MFKRKPEPETELDRVLNLAVHELEYRQLDTQEFTKLLDQVTKLTSLKQATKRPRVSPDTWAIIGANLLGILLIISYENKHVMTTKANQYTLKLPR